MLSLLLVMFICGLAILTLANPSTHGHDSRITAERRNVIREDSKLSLQVFWTLFLLMILFVAMINLTWFVD